MWPFKMTEELAVTGPFANVPFANILCRSATKRNERCACTYLGLSTTDQAKAVKELTQLVCETSPQVSEQDVDETTCRRNDSKPNWPIILDEKEIHLPPYVSETFR